MGANKLENHMVIGVEQEIADQRRDSAQQALERARVQEAIVTELAGRVDDAVTELRDAGAEEDSRSLEMIVHYLDKLAAKYEAHGEVYERELSILCSNWE